LKDRHLVVQKNEFMQENIASLQIDIENKRKYTENVDTKFQNIKKENDLLRIDLDEMKFKLFEKNRDIIESNLKESINNKNIHFDNY